MHRTIQEEIQPSSLSIVNIQIHCLPVHSTIVLEIKKIVRLPWFNKIIGTEFLLKLLCRLSCPYHILVKIQMSVRNLMSLWRHPTISSIALHVIQMISTISPGLFLSSYSFFNCISISFPSLKFDWSRPKVHIIKHCTMIKQSNIKISNIDNLDIFKDIIQLLFHRWQDSWLNP